MSQPGRCIVIYFADATPLPLPWPWSAQRPRNRATPRLRFRPVGDAGAYPDWLRELDRRSGVYVIRDRGGDVLYVGESHSDRLYGTITRHFQRWTRGWKGHRYSANDPGVRYDRADCEVAILVTHADRAVAKQNELIRKLVPRDNIQGQLPIEDPEPDEVIPF